MRSLRAALVMTVALIAPGCSDGSPPGEAPPPGEHTVTFDLGQYEPGHDPSTLVAANNTLVFPLVDGPAQQALSHEKPGDLVVAYTRVGCTVDPNDWIGPAGAVPVQVRSTPAAHLTRITIEQSARTTSASTARQLAENTCVSLRLPAGAWQPFLRPSTITTTGDSARAEFVVAATSADAAAIFLPLYTDISKITYSIKPD
jgi:hypothetical protein